MRKLTMLILAVFAAGVFAACTSTAAPTPTPTPEAPPPTLAPVPTEETIDPEQRRAQVLAAAYYIADTVDKTMPAVVQVLATVEQTNVFGQTTPGRRPGFRGVLP